MRYRLQLLLLIAILPGMTIQLLAQQDSSAMSEEYYKMGMEVFDFTHRKQSTELFVLATKFNPRNARAHFMAGKSIMLTIRKEESLPYYLKAHSLDQKVDPDILLYIGEGYQYSEKFDSAVFFYEKHAQWLARTLDFNKSLRISEVNRRIFECRNAKLFKANPVEVKIEDLSSNINSEWPDYAPNVTADESVMVFTSRRPEGNSNPSLADDHEYYEDIYTAENINGVWQPARNMGAPLNTTYHDASVNISPNGMQVFIYKDSHGGDIYSAAKKSDGTWSDPLPLTEINTAEIENSATITKDGRHLFFTSNRPGTYGGTDIFTCVKNTAGKWTDIKNLGPVVNTEYDEEDVFISANGKHLYFSSNGHAGMGDMDIYRSVYDSATDTWGEPQNLGYPINSVENDIYFVLAGDEQHAYYSSVKKENKGEQDIYRIDMTQWKPIELKNYELSTDIIQDVSAAQKPQAMIPISTSYAPPAAVPVPPQQVSQPVPASVQDIKLEIVVIDEATGAPIDAKVLLSSMQHPTISPIEKSKGTYEFDWKLTQGKTVKYELSIERQGYSPHVSPLLLYMISGVDQLTSIRDTVRIRKYNVTAGVSEVIQVLFGNDSDVPLSFDGIKKVEKLLKENEATRVEIGGHTNDQGPAEYNLSLSGRRAEAVRSYLIHAGISESRVTAAGYGEYKPIADNKTPEGRRLNRRTEFTIIE